MMTTRARRAAQVHDTLPPTSNTRIERVESSTCSLTMDPDARDDRHASSRAWKCRRHESDLHADRDGTASHTLACDRCMNTRQRSWCSILSCQWHT